MADGSGGSSSIYAQLQALANGQGSITPYSAAPKAAANPYADQLWLGGRAHGNYSPGRDAVIPSATLTPAAATEAELLPYKWLTSDKKKLQAMYAKASKATGSPVTTFEGFQAVWAKALAISQGSWAATQGGKTGSPLTPYDALDLLGRESAANGGGAHSNTSTSTSVDKLSSGNVWAILTDAATKSLGRAPTHNELRDFASRANDIAVRNPTKTTTTTNYAADGSVSSSHSSSQQGAQAADYQEAAQDKLNANPEAGAYQAATTYWDAMTRGLSSVV